MRDRPISVSKQTNDITAWSFSKYVQTNIMYVNNSVHLSKQTNDINV